MAGNSQVIYLDTCVFITWLTNEKTRTAEEIEAIAEIFRRMEKREIRIVTSVITISEILPGKIPAGVYEMLDRAMRHPNFTRYMVDIRVAKLTQDIRDYYVRNPTKDGSRVLKTPDAIHMATAILARANVFHTTDERLLRYNGNVGDHDLVIELPPRNRQLSIAFPEPDAGSS